MTEVNRSTLNSTPFEAVFSYIDNRKNISDPRSPRGRNERTFVYDTEPNVMAVDFALYPFIVCTIPYKDSPEKSVDSTSERLIWTQRIEVHTLEEGSGRNRKNQGTKDTLVICDQLDCALKSNDFRKTMMDVGLSVIGVREISKNVPVPTNQQTILQSTYELTFRTRLRVADLG